MRQRYKIIIITLLSFICGFSLSSVLSIFASKLHTAEITTLLLIEHRVHGIESIKKNDFKNALFHFRSAEYLSDRINTVVEDKRAFSNSSERQHFLYPIIATAFLTMLHILDSSYGEFIEALSNDVIALHAYALEKSGDSEKVGQKYSKVLNTAQFKDKNIDMVRRLAESIIKAPMFMFGSNGTALVSCQLSSTINSEYKSVCNIAHNDWCQLSSTINSEYKPISICPTNYNN